MASLGVSAKRLKIVDMNPSQTSKKKKRRREHILADFMKPILF